MSNTPTVDPEHFKAVMRRWAAGVTVVTTCLGNELRGCTANSFTSVSLTPPLISVTLAKRLQTYQMIHTSRVFAVNILSEAMQAVSDRFAGSTGSGGVPESSDRFQHEPYRVEQTGAPIFDRAMGFADCRLVQEFDLGTNVILVGEVLAGRAQNDDLPLLYFNRKYWGLKA